MWEPSPARLFDQYVVRNARKVERGTHVWTHEVSEWLREKADEYGWEQLALWAECSDKTLRLAEAGDSKILDLGIVDRLVTREGSTSLSVLCPLAA